MFKRRIYLDYASLTPIDSRVLREMKAFSAPAYANPSSLYKAGVAAKKALAQMRTKTATFIHAHPDEIVFTSGGTEANGLALEGTARQARMGGIEKPHMIISAIEHSSIIEVAALMEKQGCEVTRLSVDHSGIISLEELKKAIKPNTFLVSIMTVNNEIGSIQPIREIVKIIRHARKVFKESGQGKGIYPLFHTDAAQAALYQELNMEKLGVDLLTLDGSKVYGPRGIGCLYIRRGTPIQPIIYGGGQEVGMRSGTENIPGIAGFAKALEIAAIERDREAGRLVQLREYFIEGLKVIRPDIVVNGAVFGAALTEKTQLFSSLSQSDEKVVTSSNSQKGVPPLSTVIQALQSPHILNVSIPGIDNEFFVLQLDAKGIACSTKSSCLRDEDESYVLKAVGADSNTAVRFSFGRSTKKGDIRQALAVMRKLC